MADVATGTIAETVAAGFAHPVFDAQASFRAVLSALARPGRIVTLDRLPEAPAALQPAAAAVLLSLADFDTPVWLDAATDTEAVRGFLRFHCGCPLAEVPERAAFALIGDAAAMPPLGAFDAGSDDYPDRSATLVIQVGQLDGEAGWTLSGSGIDGTARLTAAPLPEAFAAQLRANHARYPLGVDLLFAAGSRLAGLPRSTRIEGD